MEKIRKIAIFASGSGTNAQAIIERFKDSKIIKVDSVFSNKEDAFVLQRAKGLNVPAYIINREKFYSTNELVGFLNERGIDLIVLAGFLWLVPENLIKSFTIINIHPALLPKYGGKGMYGMRVHQAVVDNKESKSGITIHYVNEVYDDGKIIFQAKCNINEGDSPEDVARKVHELEYKYYPEIIEGILTGGQFVDRP